MQNKLFVAGLDFQLTNEALAELFAACGTVTSAQIVTDRETGRSRGFGFVEMSTAEEAAAAVSQLNGKDVSGRSMVVNIAKPKEAGSRPGGGGGGGRRY